GGIGSLNRICDRVRAPVDLWAGVLVSRRLDALVVPAVPPSVRKRESSFLCGLANAGRMFRALLFARSGHALASAFLRPIAQPLEKRWRRGGITGRAEASCIYCQMNTDWICRLRGACLIGLFLVGLTGLKMASAFAQEARSVRTPAPDWKL